MEMEAVIFDVDGTIWDSAKEVAEAWTEAFQNYPESKGRVLTAADLEPYMGLTMEAIGEGLLPGLEKERREEIMCYAMEYENIYLAKHPGRFFPDFVSTVKSLEKAGKKLFIVSNCQSGYIEAMLTAAGLAFGEGQIFRDIECFGNTGKSSREKTVYLGDTALDRASAKECGIPFIFASYGFGNPESFEEKITCLKELPEALERLAKRG